MTLGSFLEDAAGDDDRYVGVTDDELLGVICAWDRAEAHMAARKHAVVAELIRRRPGRGGWDEFTGRELGAVLGLSFGEAEEVLGLASALADRLPGTQALFRSGILSQDNAAVIAYATALLESHEARAAEAMVLDRAGSLTPAALRAAIRRAVMEVNPAKARQRREHASRLTRVERWSEDSGNAGLAGRELPPAEVLAADQRVTAWAKELRKAGLAGGMDTLRARAYLDLLLGTKSRPLAGSPQGRHEPRTPAPAGPVSGLVPPGFAGRVTLTVPATTLLDLADRPGEVAGIGPIDPDPGANTPGRYQFMT